MPYEVKGKRCEPRAIVRSEVAQQKKSDTSVKSGVIFCG